MDVALSPGEALLEFTFHFTGADSSQASLDDEVFLEMVGSDIFFPSTVTHDDNVWVAIYGAIAKDGEAICTRVWNEIVRPKVSGNRVLETARIRLGTVTPNNMRQYEVLQ